MDWLKAHIRKVQAGENIQKRHALAGIVAFGVFGYLFFSFVIPIFAAPPTSQYNPGETLDPGCSPGDTNCSVVPPISGTGVAGRVPFFISTSTVSSTAAFYWDNTNSRLGLGTTQPSSTLHIVGGGITQSGGVNSIASTTINGQATTTALSITGISGSTQCLQVNSAGVVSGTGVTCGAGSGNVSVTSANTVAGYIPAWTTSASSTLSATSSLFWDSTNDRIAVGTTTATAKLEVSFTNPIANTDVVAIATAPVINGGVSGSFSGKRVGIQSQPILNSGVSGLGSSNFYGVESNPQANPTFTGSGAFMSISGFKTVPVWGGSGLGVDDDVTIDGFSATLSSDLGTTGSTRKKGATLTVSGTAGNNYGLYADVTGATNNYGVYIVNPASSSNNYALYSGATAKSYFAGFVGIGTTAPSSALHIVGGGITQSGGVNSIASTTINGQATTTALSITSISGSTQCLRVNSSGVVSGTGADCETSSSTGANPTATIGLTAVNGTANTFMRSDAAPALSQSITPTWTGAHIFNGGLTANSTSTFSSSTIVNGQLTFGSASGTNVMLSGFLSASGQSTLTSVSTTNITASGFGTFPTLNFTTASGTGVLATNVTTTNLTISSISGSTQCLQVNSSGVVSGTGVTCGAGSGNVSVTTANVLAGYIPAWTTAASSTLSATSSLFWDSANGRIGIGTTQPSSTLHVIGTLSQSGGVASLASTTINGQATTTALSITGLTAGSIPFIGTNGVVSQNNANLFWDSTNARLGVGTNGPVNALTVVAGLATTSKASIAQSLINDGGAPTTIASSSYLNLGGAEFGANSYRLLTFGYKLFGTDVNVPAYIGYQETNASGRTNGDLIFGTRSVTTDTAPSERLRITTAGAVLVATTTTPTNALFAIATSSPIFTVLSTARVGIGTSSPATALDVVSDGVVVSSTFTGIAFARDTTGVKGISLGYNTTGGVGAIAATGGSDLGFWTDNTGWGERVRLTSAGLLGIGTTQPSSTLHVVGGATITTNVTTTNLTVSSISGSTQCLQVNSSGVVSGTGAGCAGNGIAGSGTSTQLAFFGNATTLTSDPSITYTTTTGIFAVSATSSFTGKVGIGTATPLFPLHVSSTLLQGSTSSLVFLGPNILIGGSASGTLLGANVNTTFNGHFLNFQQNSSTKFFISSTGTVGVGTISPTAKFSIVTTSSFKAAIAYDVTDNGAAHTAVASSSYLHLGGAEFGAISYRLLTFGYRSTGTDTAFPAYIGYQEIGASGRTNGDLVFGTRNVLTDTAPTERLRIRRDGTVEVGQVSQGNALASTFNVLSTSTYMVNIMRTGISGSNNAITSVGSSSSYLHLGGGEFGVNSYRLISFGWRSNGATTNFPAYMGFQETSQSGNTMGDLVFGTRDNINDTAPTERLRITNLGNLGIGTSQPSSTLHVVGTSTLLMTNNVAIGTITPLAMFHVAGRPTQTTSSTLILFSTSTIQGGNASGTFIGINTTSTFNGDLLNFQVNSSTKFRVSSTGTAVFAGNLAVGSTSASTTLTVTGSSYVSGTSTIDGFLGVGTNVLGGVARQAAFIGASGVLISTSAANLSATGAQALVVVAGTTTPTSGIFSAHSNVGGTSAEKFRINANGNVGILTTAPNSPLSVATLPFESSTSTLVLLGSNFITGGNASGTFLGANPTSTFSGDFINFQVGSSTKFLVSGTGTVTIGKDLSVTGNATTTNLSITSISGSTQCLRVDTNGVVSGTGSACGAGNGNVITTAASTLAGYFPIWTTSASTTLSATSSLYWDSTNARIGIGTTQPSSTLHVLGDINASNGGVYKLNSLTILNGSSTAATTFVGLQAGNGNTTGQYNTAVGYQAAFTNATGSQVTAVGYQAGYSNTISQNDFFGYQAGYNNTTGNNNVVLGRLAGFTNATGSFNTIAGFSAGYYNVGSQNTFIGAQAGAGASITGGSNAFFGASAGYSATTGQFNTNVGASAGYSNTTGDSNIAIGSTAGYSNSTGTGSIAIGDHAGYNNTIGEGVFIGYYAGQQQSTGVQNTFVGAHAGRNSTTGNYNTYVGYSTGYSSNASYATAVGYQAGNSNTADFNSFFGYQAGYTNSTGTNNAFFGLQAGYLNSGGSNNSFFGYNASRQNATGIHVTSIGTAAGYNNTTGGYNTNLGSSAGYNNATGSNITAIGYQAGNANTVGDNSFFGVQSGFNNTVGTGNTFLGQYSGYNNTTASNNVYVGYYAAFSNVTGTQNTIIGKDAGYNNPKSGNVFIGYQAGYNATSSNELYIANSNAAIPLIYGDFANSRIGLGTNTPDTNAKITIVGATSSTLPSSAATVLVLGSSDGTTGGSSIRGRGTITGGLADFGEYAKVEGERSAYAQGDLLVISASSTETFAKSSSTYQENLAGVVTETAGILAGGGDETIEYDEHGKPINRVVIALAGRVPVKVSLENGPVKHGDYLTASSKPGVAMKQTAPGATIGRAIEVFDETSPKDADGIGKVMVFVESGFSLGSGELVLATSTVATNNPALAAMDRFTVVVQNAIAKLGIVIADGVARLKEIFADKVTTKELCIDDVCVNKQQLQQLLQSQSNPPPQNNTGGEGNSTGGGSTGGGEVTPPNTNGSSTDPGGNGSSTDAGTSGSGTTGDGNLSTDPGTGTSAGTGDVSAPPQETPPPTEGG